MYNIQNYPLEYQWRNYDFDDQTDFVDFMEFRLVYEGALQSSGNSSRHVKQKHAIRKQIHKQLANLWDIHPVLNHFKTFVDGENGWFVGGLSTKRLADEGITYVETLARSFSRCGFRFVPLVHKNLDLVCSLDILFLRRENPGELIKQSGDVDNRVKTLLDALQMPQNCNEVEGEPEVSEQPFYCLLENDSLITQLTVTTDRLLTPLKEGEHKNEVVLIIKVKVKAAKVYIENLELISY